MATEPAGHLLEGDPKMANISGGVKPRHLEEGGSPKMAQIHYGVKTSRKQGGPKLAKIQNGVKPDIFKFSRLSLGVARVSHDSPRAQTATFEVPAFKKTTKIPRKDPRERQKERKWEREREKKRKFLGPPTLQGPPSGPHPFGPTFSGFGPPFGTTQTVKPLKTLILAENGLFLKNTTKIQREDTQRERNRTKMEAGEEKEERKFGRSSGGAVRRRGRPAEGAVQRRRRSGGAAKFLDGEPTL